MTTFAQLGVNEKINKGIEEIGFTEPMPIQEKVIPVLLRKKDEDIIALAQTGTGKTAAFGIPVIQLTDTNKKTTQHLILAPTRELCVQISKDITSFAKYQSNLKVAAVYGGASIEKQIKDIKKGAQIICATPGRLIDLINRNVVKIEGIKTVVLDEADEMLNMGFREDLEIILAHTPIDKRVLLFSATMPKEILTIANNYMSNPIEITVGQRNAGAENVEHICFFVHEKDRYLALKRIVDFYPDVYGIVFCRTRMETKQVADNLIKDGYNADALHGDLSQVQRDAVMKKFRIKNLSLLVATDVAARGLDVENLSHIINYNIPEDLEIYTHRSGRTGRAGKNGTSIIIANLKEKQKIRKIENQIKKKFEYREVPSGKAICEKQLVHLIDKMKNVKVDYSEIDSFLPIAYEKLESLSKEEIINRFVSLEFNRFLDYYKHTKDLAQPEEKKRGRTKGAANEFTRFFINLGKKDDIKPVRIMGMVNDYTDTPDIEIGNIEILDNFSFFEADADYTDIILESFKGKKRKKRTISVEIAESKKRDKKNKNKEKRNFSDKSDSRRKRRSNNSGNKKRSRKRR